MQRGAKRSRDEVRLGECTLASLPHDTFCVNYDNDVLCRLLELLPEHYASKTVHEHRLSEAFIVHLILCARALIASEANLVEIDSPVYVCGDLHGQYYDLINIFTRCPPLNGTVFGPRVWRRAKKSEDGGDGAVSDNGTADDGEGRQAKEIAAAVSSPLCHKFLFLGDYVDRGARSIEVVVTLLALKIIAPSHFFILRGNHEDEQIMFLYGFFDECKRRYGVKLFKVFADLFRVLPVAAVVNGAIFCTHGGLSAELSSVYDIPDARPCSVPHSGVVCDLLWADPELHLPDGVDWAPSSRRISSVFSRAALSHFLQDNNLDLVCRAHQVVEEGFQFFPSNQARQLLTIFSATNYCNEFGNRGGVLCVDAQGTCSILTLEPPSFVQQRTISSLIDTTAAYK